jgi:hypothetical protein
MVFSIAGLLLGCWLGLRFKAFALVPVTVAALFLLWVLSFVSSLHVSGMVFVATMVALNVGYVAATTIRFVIAPALSLTSSPVLSRPIL